MFRPYGTVDVTNGDQTYTLHNRYGSWMHDVWNGNGAAAEPARVAAWLGIIMSQAEMGQKLTQRFEAELKKQGIPHPASAARAPGERRSARASKARTLKKRQPK
jgi:hypothetical protein